MTTERPMIRARQVSVLVLIGVIAAGCGGSSSNALPTHSSVKRTTTTSTSTTTTTTLPPEWPKEVPTATVPPKILLHLGGAAGQPTVIEVNPGIYNGRGVGPLGTVRDYAIGAVGVCTDLHTFVTDFRISGGFSKLTVVRFHAPHDLTVICQFVGRGHA